MVVIKNNIMYSCRATLFGSDAPEEGKRGVEALQDPIRSCYGNLQAGLEVTVTIMPEEINVEYTNRDAENFSLPIRTLSVCAALRRVDGTDGMRFIPVHSISTANEDDVVNPPIFVTSMRRSESESLLCFMFRCDETRDALHLVNATQWAHTSFRRGYSASGTMRLFFEQSAEFDRTIRLQTPRSTSQRIFNYNGTSESAVRSTEARTYVSTIRGAHESTSYTRVEQNGDAYLNGDRTDGTYYIKAGDYRPQTPERMGEPDTIYINANIEQTVRPPTPQQQTIIVEKPVIKPPMPIRVPPPKVIEKEVMVETPMPPRIEPLTIYVDKPVFKPFKKWEVPQPIVKERVVMIDPPDPPKQDRPVIIVDKPIVKEYPPPPKPLEPIIKERPYIIEAPQWPKQEPQVIVVDQPVLKPMPPPPPQPEPIIQRNPVYIDCPEYPPQEPHKIVVEVPHFNPPKPVPPPPAPIIEKVDVYIDPPPYQQPEPQRIVVEKPVVRDAGPPPKCPPPVIIEKPVYVDGPKYQQPEPQRIVVEKVMFRDPGPPPPCPPPIIIEKIKWVDPPPWPKQEPQKIIVEKPVIRQRPAPPPPKPIIIEKPKYVDLQAPAPPPAQRIVVEKPVFTGQSYTYSRPEARQYVVQSGSPRGLRRYAYSENGDYQQQGGNYVTTTTTNNARLYGQPRDFRFIENQHMNERRFGTRINQEIRQTRAPRSYTYGYGGGEAYHINDRQYRRGSLSS